jgi:hypothetical protein
VSECSAFVGCCCCGKISAIFFIALFNFPCCETPKNAVLKETEQNNRGRKKEGKTAGGKPHFW